MAVVNKNKKSTITQRTTENRNSKKANGGYFDGYEVVDAIKESGEYYAEVKEHCKKDTEYIVFTPYDKVSGRKVYYEEVYLTIGKTNSKSLAAGQFISLFRGARGWHDIKNRVVGIEIKLNEGKDQKVYKNIVHVFETDEDELIFDDAHMRCSLESAKAEFRKVLSDVIDDDDKTAYVPKKTLQSIVASGDSEDDDEDYIEDDEEDFLDEFEEEEE